MDDNALPTEAFDQLLDKLAKVLSVARNQNLSQEAGGTLTNQAKQELLNTTNDFKDSISRALKLASSLPGGDVPPEEQDEVISALEELRDRKRKHLQSFSALVEQVKQSQVKVDNEGESTLPLTLDTGEAKGNNMIV